MRRRVALLARGPRPPGPPPCANAPAAARPPKGSGPGPGGGKCPHSRPARSRAYRRSAKEVFGALLPLSGSPLGRRPAVAFSPLRVLPPCCAVLARLARCGRRAPAPLSRPASVVFSLALSRSRGPGRSLSPRLRCAAGSLLGRPCCAVPWALCSAWPRRVPPWSPPSGLRARGLLARGLAAQAPPFLSAPGLFFCSRAAPAALPPAGVSRRRYGSARRFA